MNVSLFPLKITPAVTQKVRSILEEEGESGLKLRIYVNGGGCSGFQYGFSFDEDMAEDDFMLEQDGVTIVVDSVSMQYLQGAEVDYRESLQGSEFVVRNPNAKSTCSCGQSFAS
jgi:iron-sulfur cluster insertion protein